MGQCHERRREWRISQNISQRKCKEVGRGVCKKVEGLQEVGGGVQEDRGARRWGGGWSKTMGGVESWRCKKVE
jgi:hypothetical protein